MSLKLELYGRAVKQMLISLMPLHQKLFYLEFDICVPVLISCVLPNHECRSHKVQWVNTQPTRNKPVTQMNTLLYVPYASQSV